MATKTTDDMLADVRRHIDELEARAGGGAAETRARLQDRFDRLRDKEASAWAAVRAKAEAVDENYRELEIDIAIAENRLASEMADDAISFARAVEAELQDWDAAIERLQTRAATKSTGSDREQAEAEIAALRQARNRAAERLTALRASSDAWQGQKSRVVEALDELERKARDAAVEVPVNLQVQGGDAPRGGGAGS